MRVERNSATPPLGAPARIAKPKSSSAKESDQGPTERWDGPSVDEREAQAATKSDFVPPEFPGIKQGLTADYLRPRRTSAPTTLLAATGPSMEFALNCFPTRSRQTESGLRYAEDLATHTRALYQKYFPDEFLDLDLFIQMEVGERNNAGYEWVQGRSRLTLQTSTLLVDEPFMQKTEGTLNSAHQFRRGVSDLISFVHEYAHATYDALLGVPAGIDVLRANRAFSEGFAVLFELLSIDHLLTLPENRIFPGDQAGLATRREDRVVWLQQALEGPVPPAQLAYAEGTELMANLHREGGLTEVVRFVKDVVPNKANALSRSHPDYQKAACCPRKIRSLVC